MTTARKVAQHIEKHTKRRTKKRSLRAAREKHPEEMTAKAINRELETLERRRAKLMAEKSLAWNSRKSAGDYMTVTAPYAAEEARIAARKSALRHEIERKYGPSGLHRFP
jgi:hypothetical protein